MLILDVNERKIIQTVILNGVKAEKNKKLIMNSLALKDKSPYDEFLAKQDISKIKSALNASGFYFSKVDGSIQDNQNGTIDLILVGCISVLIEPKNSHSNSRLNCSCEVFAIVSFFHFSSRPGISLQ